jgi:competence protein ComEA
MIRRLFWLSTAAGAGYLGYIFWRWSRQQNKPSPVITQALAGRLYEPQTTTTTTISASAAVKRPAVTPAAEGTQSRRIVTRVHKGAPPSPPLHPAAPDAAEAPAAPTGAGLSFGPEIVGATDAPAEATPSVQDSSPTNINSADEDALVALPGIGRSLARRIITYRDEHGPFDTIDQLEVVQGIGPRNIDEFRHLVTV